MDKAKCKPERRNILSQEIQSDGKIRVKIKEEEVPTDISTDGSSNRNTPERYLSPQHSQDCTGEELRLDKHIKEENLNIVIVDIGPEIQREDEIRGKIKEEEIPTDIGPVHMNTRKGYLRNPYKKWWSPAKNNYAVSHKMDLSKKKMYSEYLMNPQFLKEFIDAYRSFPCLWNVKYSDYSNKQKRSKAYEKLVGLCKSVCPTANIQFVKHKIANLRTVFKKEFNKVQVSKKSAACVQDIYVPRLWYYDLLKFTIGQDLPRKSLSTSSQETHKARQEDEHADENLETLEESTNLSQVTSNSQSDDVDFEIQEVIPMRKQKKRKMYKEDDLSNELLSQAAAILSKNDDEYDAFGITVASKLRRMEEKQRLIAEVLITDILYKGMLNQINEETYVAEYSDQYYPPNPIS
ncbi:lysophospholipase-like protein 1 isoform X1 [Pseudophryne corroboree]|uniref:lysophospholipase-like protein 1 isoform X1 n=1 Tax=Pseudophryne corroboree TaxID=495146 RepID=UPI003081D990